MIKLKLLLSLLLLASLSQAQERFNGSFEHLDAQGNPIGWDLTYNGQNKFEVKLDSVVKKTGKYAVSISSRPGSTNAAIQFPINQAFHGTSLILIASLKTENVTEGFAGLWVRVEDAYGKELAFETMKSQDLTGTNDWKEYMIELRYHDDEAIKITAGALLIGKGKIWVDDMKIYIDEITIEKTPLSNSANYPALKDKEFEKGSGIDTIITNKAQLKNLRRLGELWGFLKYHHPTIAVGERNWDAELFRILPKVLALTSDKSASILFENWMDGLGPVPDCKDCIPTKQLKDLVVQPDYGILLLDPGFSKSLNKKLAHLIANSNNKSHYYIRFEMPAGNPIFKHERDYENWNYPDVGYRLLALYRYWSMIQYFSPNREIAQDWDKILTDFIPEIIAVSDQYQYVNTLVKLTSRIKDTHAFINSKVYEKTLGRYRLPFQAKFLGEQLVVTAYIKERPQLKQQIEIGDVLTSINGVEVKELIKKYLPYIPVSNYTTALRDMPVRFLLRSHDPLFKLGISRSDRLLTVDLEAFPNKEIEALARDYDPNPDAAAFQLLSPKICYIYCRNYRVSQLEQIRDQFKHTDGIVIDMRNYPKDEMSHSLGGYLKADSSSFARTTTTSIRRPGAFQYDASFKTGQKTAAHYQGKIVVIVNSMTQSNAEWVAMSLQTAPQVRVIGSPTAGADGNISEISLPGGFITNLSGIGIYYPDDTNAQGVGVKIDQLVIPTIEGIKKGKDELLEAAKLLLSK